MEAVYLSAVW